MPMKLLSLIVPLLLHPVHVSLTGIEYDSNSRVYYLSVKVYSDDLVADINLGLLTGERIQGETDQRYFQYLSDRIMIIEDGRALDMKLQHSESDGLEHRFKLEAYGGKRVTEVRVVNRIMTRLYDDQANMLIFSFGKMEEGYRFTAADTIRDYIVR
ncbi:MAG: hypothetical protein P1P83_01145 [Bacteroidales bacterium]|nr:hypothetical protein [Bacteroidales bacterium]MDT8372628.1 hypothetical protein [Bacteroidales bacterium]